MLIRNRERKKLIFVLLLSLLPSEYSWAQSLVARVQATQLSAGTHYTWTYFQSVDSNGLRSPDHSQPYSREIYTVLGWQGPRVKISLSSSYFQDGVWSELQTHHSFQMDFRKCEAMDRQGGFPSRFLLDLTPVGGETLQVSDTAFTEKFNCSSQVIDRAGALFRTVFSILNVLGGRDGTAVFQQRRANPAHELNSQFVQKGELAGVAIFKNFLAVLPTERYFFELTDYELK